MTTMAKCANPEVIRQENVMELQPAFCVEDPQHLNTRKTLESVGNKTTSSTSPFTFL